MRSSSISPGINYGFIWLAITDKEEEGASLFSSSSLLLLFFNNSSDSSLVLLDAELEEAVVLRSIVPLL